MLQFSAFAEPASAPADETYTLTFKIGEEFAWKDGSLGLSGTASTEGTFPMLYNTYSFELPAGHHIALADYPVYCPAESHYGLEFWAVTPDSGIGLTDRLREIDGFMMPASDVTLTAHMIEYYTIRYVDGVGGEAFSKEPYTVSCGSQVPSFSKDNEDPTRSGFVFEGWIPACPNIVDYDYIFTAQWRVAPKITVAGGDRGFETINGALPLSITTANAPGGIITSKDNNGTLLADPSTDTATLAVTTPGAYAVTVTTADHNADTATQRFNIVQVNFDSKGGTEVPYQLLRTPPDGGDAGATAPDPGDGGTEYLSLVSFYAADETPTASEPDAPTNGDLKFLGWYTSEDAGATLSDEPYDFDTKVTEGFTLYAAWAPKEVLHTVTFTIATEKGTTTDPTNFINVKQGTTISAPTVTANDGYVFDCWDKPVETTVNADAAYTAQFIDLHQISFDPNNGTAETSTVWTNVTGTVDALMPAPENADCSFVGWFTEAEDGTEVSLDTIFTQDTTVYAHWADLKPTNTPAPAVYYDITLSQVGSGTITPDGGSDHIETVLQNSDETITFTPAPGYQVSNVFIDGVSIGAVPNYTFQKVMSNHSLTVVFTAVDSHANPQTGIME